MLLLNNQYDYICLNGLDNDSLDSLNYDAVDDAHFLQQGGEAWRELWSEAKSTGSTTKAAVGLSSLKEKKEHFRRVMINKEERVFSDDVKKRLEHG